MRKCLIKTVYVTKIFFWFDHILNKKYAIKLICAILKNNKLLFFEFFRVLKCVTKRECVTA